LKTFSEKKSIEQILDDRIDERVGRLFTPRESEESLQRTLDSTCRKLYPLPQPIAARNREITHRFRQRGINSRTRPDPRMGTGNTRPDRPLVQRTSSGDGANPTAVHPLIWCIKNGWF